MQCQFYCDEKDKLGIDSEVQGVPITCNAKAKDVLRLKTISRNRIQSHLIFKRIAVCTKHGDYLREDAPFKWEKLSITPEEQHKEQLIKIPIKDLHASYKGDNNDYL